MVVFVHAGLCFFGVHARQIASAKWCLVQARLRETVEAMHCPEKHVKPKRCLWLWQVIGESATDFLAFAHQQGLDRILFNVSSWILSFALADAQ